MRILYELRTPSRICCSLGVQTTLGFCFLANVTVWLKSDIRIECDVLHICGVTWFSSTAQLSNRNPTPKLQRPDGVSATPAPTNVESLKEAAVRKCSYILGVGLN